MCGRLGRGSGHCEATQDVTGFLVRPKSFGRAMRRREIIFGSAAFPGQMLFWLGTRARWGFRAGAGIPDEGSIIFPYFPILVALDGGGAKMVIMHTQG